MHSLTSVSAGSVRATSVSSHPPAKCEVVGPSVSFIRCGLSVPWDPRYASLLDFAEACEVPVHWSCRIGLCHKCVSRLIDGTIGYEPEPLSRPAEGNVLICCSTPLTAVQLDL